MAFDLYKLDQLAKEAEKTLPKGGSSDASNAGVINDNTNPSNLRKSVMDTRKQTLETDEIKERQFYEDPKPKHDRAFLDYQTQVIDKIHVAMNAKSLYTYLSNKMSKKRGLTNTYNMGKIDKTAESTIKIPTYLISCLKQEIGSMDRIKNATLVIGFLVWYFGLNPADFDDSENISIIVDQLSVSASPSRMSAHTGNIAQNVDDKLSDFEDSMGRMIRTLDRVNTNVAQSEENIGKILMISAYNALNLIGRASLIKSNEPLDDIDILDNMRVWDLMKAIDSAWMYDSRTEGREQYRRKVERERKRVMYAAVNQPVDSVPAYQDEDFDRYNQSDETYAPVEDETQYSLSMDEDDGMFDYDDYDEDEAYDYDTSYDVETEAEADDAFRVMELERLKDVDIKKYMAKKKEYEAYVAEQNVKKAANESDDSDDES